MALPRRVAHAQAEGLTDRLGPPQDAPSERSGRPQDRFGRPQDLGALAGVLPWLLAPLCLAASGVVAARVVGGDGRLGTLALYLGSLAGYLWLLGLRAVPRPRPGRGWLLPSAFAALQLAAAAYFASAPAHFHYDEFITAHASLTLGPIERIDWFAAYPESGWVARFPIPFFALQAPLLHLLGPSVEAVRISVWPYLVGTVVYLWLLARASFPERWAAAAAVALLVFLAANLYLSSLGVHFASSTLFLLAAVYHWGRKRPDHAVLCGVWLALCYLTYTSSYLALPLLAPFMLAAPRLGLRALAAGAATLLPFGVYAASHHNYFWERPTQVKAELSWHALAASVSHLYTPGGGVTHYHFGHLALFEPLTPALLLIGALCAVAVAWRQRSATSLIPIAAIVLAFVVGVAMTNPPGALHRFGVALPFVALLLARAVRAMPSRLVAAPLLIVVLAANWLHAEAMIRAEPVPPSVPIADLLVRELPPGVALTIAADPTFHLERELFFRTGDRFRIKTGWWDDVRDDLNGEPVVIYMPSVGNLLELAARFPGGRLFEFEKYAVWLPAG
jgi:hypothetical protein